MEYIAKVWRYHMHIHVHDGIHCQSMALSHAYPSKRWYKWQCPATIIDDIDSYIYLAAAIILQAYIYI